jgi:UDP-N-acetylglucosamine acyltransferase
MYSCDYRLHPYFEDHSQMKRSLWIASFILVFILQNSLQGSIVDTKLKIHPTAIIHPSVIMEGDIEVGAHTTVGANSYLKGPLVIGANNQIGQQVMIGVDPEHKTKQATGVVTIGNDNVIREFSVIQRGIGDLDTQIQDNCFIMAYAYIAHDCLIESDVILCARVSLSGHCRILKGAVLGLACSLHHFSTIGAHALVGMGSVVVKDVPPFCVVLGNPARFEKFNSHSFEQLGITVQDLMIEDYHLKSTHSYVSECIENFGRHVRRKVVPIEFGKI